MHPGRVLLYIGLAIAAAGLVWMLASTLGLGKLPGDLVIRRKNFTLHLPLVSSLLLSLLLTLLLYLFRK
jgi:hypothetical protein